MTQSVKILLDQDADGYLATVINISTNKKRFWRFDQNKGGNLYVRYDLMRKPTTREHQIVDVGTDGFEEWIGQSNVIEQLSSTVL